MLFTRKEQMSACFRYLMGSRFSFVIFFIGVVKAIGWAPTLCSLPGEDMSDLFVDFALREKETFTTSLPPTMTEERASRAENEYFELLRENMEENKHFFDSKQTTTLFVNPSLVGILSFLAFSCPLAIINLFPALIDRQGEKKKGSAMKKTKPSLVFWILLSSLLAGTASASLTETVPASGTGSASDAVLHVPPVEVATSCGLACWLSRINITIPPVSFNVLGSNITIESLTCRGITFGGINSSLVPPTGLDALTYGLGTSCFGNWSTRENAWPHLSSKGNVTAVISDSSCRVNMSLNKNTTNGLVSNASVASCDTVITVSKLTFKGKLFAGFLEIISGLLKSFISKAFSTVACTGITGLIDTNLTQVIQGINNGIEPWMGPIKPDTPPPVPAGMTNFTESPVIAILDWLLDDLIGANGPLGLNKIVDFFTNGTGAIRIKNMSVAIPVPIKGLGELTFGLLELNITGLDTWGKVDFIVPVGNHTLRTETLLKNLSFGIQFFVNVSIDTSSGTESPSLGANSLYEEGRLEMSMHDNDFVTTLFLALVEERIENIKDLANLLNGTCLMQTLYTMNFTSMYINSTIDSLSITAVEGDVEADLDAFLSDILTLFTNSFDAAIPAFLNHYVTGPLRAGLNDVISEKTSFSSMLDNSCFDEPASEEALNKTATIASFSVAAGSYIMLVLIMLILEYQKKKKESPEQAAFFYGTVSTSSNSEDDVSYVSDGKAKISVQDDNIYKQKDLCCLGLSSNLPWWLRYIIPLAIMANICLFISSNASNAAEVKLVLSIGDETHYTEPVFSFSLSSSVRDMWKAGIYPLALLIVILSGAWPYIKLMLMFVCWVLPARVLKPKAREIFLMVLDALGKWSLVDAFVMALMMVAFRFNLNDPGNNVNIDVFVNPVWGFHSFLAATMMSLTLSHIILACHRRGVKKSEGKKSYHSKKLKPLFLTMWKRKGWKYAWGVFVTLLIAAATACVIAGSIIDSFTFSYKGLAGLILDVRGFDSSTDYSLITVGTNLPTSAQHPDSFAVRWIQAAFFTFALAVPLALMLVLAILWLVPMPTRFQRSLFHVAEVFNAWSALEVFILAVIASLLEIEQFSQFIIGDACDSINSLLKQYLKPYLDGDYKCYDVEATLLIGSWVLFSACVIYVVAAIIVLKASHTALDKRKKEAADYRAVSINTDV